MTDERLVGCLSRLPKVPDGAGILVPCLLGWFEIGFEGAFNPNASATGWAGEQRITLEPSDRLREFVAALRAFDVDGTTIKEGWHNDYSAGCVATPTVAGRGAISTREALSGKFRY
jgi:hypothetical protein